MNFVTPHLISADIFSNTKQTILFDLTFVIIHHMRRKYKQHSGGKCVIITIRKELTNPAVLLIISIQITQAKNLEIIFEWIYASVFVSLMLASGECMHASFTRSSPKRNTHE